VVFLTNFFNLIYFKKNLEQVAHSPKVAWKHTSITMLVLHVDPYFHNIFPCQCFKVRILVVKGGSLVFSFINSINLWCQVSNFRNFTLVDQVWSLKLYVHFFIIEAWWGFFPHLFMLWQWDKRAFRIGAFLIFEVVGFLL
jgi:hypothetical protein